MCRYDWLWQASLVMLLTLAACGSPELSPKTVDAAPGSASGAANSTPATKEKVDEASRKPGSVVAKPETLDHRVGGCESEYPLDMRIGLLDMRTYFRARELVTSALAERVEGERTKEEQYGSFDFLVSAARAWHLTVARENPFQSCDPISPLALELVELEGALADFPSRGSEDLMLEQDTARYFHALDTERWLCDGVRSRALWKALIERPLGEWRDGGGPRRVWPKNGQQYLASVRLALADNYRRVEPKDPSEAVLLLRAVLDSASRDHPEGFARAAICRLAEMRSAGITDFVP